MPAATTVTGISTLFCPDFAVITAVPFPVAVTTASFPTCIVFSADCAAAKDWSVLTATTAGLEEVHTTGSVPSPTSAIIFCVSETPHPISF